APAAKRVLYMTHLQGGRAKESVWFLERVWPKVIQTHPDAELLLAGTPPLANSDMARSLPPEAQVLGYVEDLVALYSSATVAVVPIVHSTGLINRALDALVAGVPLVSTPAVLSTIANCEPGRDAIAAYSATDFSQAICTLLANPEQRKTYSIQGRALAQQQPTWQESTNAIVSALREICHLEKSASPASPVSQESSQTTGEKKPKERSTPSLQPHS
ncbi:MAG: glycosyltransferase family 4 protein, partial [Cyanobacteria bacterium J06607_10]